LATLGSALPGVANFGGGREKRAVTECHGNFFIWLTLEKLSPAGIEPATHGLKGRWCVRELNRF
jgi:hypothetical protein